MRWWLCLVAVAGRAWAQQVYEDDFDHDVFKVTTVLAQPAGSENANLSISFQYLPSVGATLLPLPRRVLVEEHARLVHVVVVSEDLEWFAHVHPEDFDHNEAYHTDAPTDAPADFVLPLRLPRAGRYLVALNYVVNTDELDIEIPEEAPHSHERGGAFVSLSVDTQVIITAEGLPAMHTPVMAWDARAAITVPGVALQSNQVMADTLNLLSEQARCCAAVSDVSEHCGAMATNPFPTLPSCYDLSLAVGAMDMMGSPSDVGMGMPDTLQATAGACTMLTLTARNSSTGSILPDLTPYLAAGMHVFAVAADMQWSAHLHGMLPGAAMNMGCGYHAMTMPPATFASPLAAHVTFPAAGKYKVFTSITHAAQVIHAAFTVTVVSADRPVPAEMDAMSDTLAPLGSCAWTQCPSASPTSSSPPTSASPTSSSSPTSASPTAPTASSPTAAAPTSAPPPPWGAAVPDAVEAKAPVNDAGTHNGGGLLACVLLLLTYLAW